MHNANEIYLTEKSIIHRHRKCLRKYETAPTLVNLSLLVGIWLLIVALVVLTEYLGYIWLLITMPLIVSLQYHLQLLLHEAVHGTFMNNNKLADRVCDLLVAYPMGSTTALFRKFHLSHHGFIGTEKDPDFMIVLKNKEFQFPMPRSNLLLFLWHAATSIKLLDAFSSLSVVRAFFISQDRGGLSNADRIILIMYIAILATVFTIFGIWHCYIIYWVLPMAFMTRHLTFIRSVLEHAAATKRYDTALTQTYTTRKPSILEKMYLCPLGINYHIEHHLFPKIPWCRLKKIHEVLMQDKDFKSNAKVLDSYVFGENSLINQVTI